MSPSTCGPRLVRGEPSVVLTASGDELRYWTFTADQPGPIVSIVSGIHGNEVAGVLALKRFVQSGLPLTAGTVHVLPVSHPSAHAANTRVSPVDGQNLARVFPGSAEGTNTEQLAHAISTELIVGSDVLIDLHTSSPDTDMPFFAGCLDDGSPECALAIELCDAFGAGTVWTHPSTGPGRTLSVAHEHGISAFYVESPRGGVLPSATLEAYADGVLRVLAHLGMLSTDAAPRALPTRLRLYGNGNTDLSATAEEGGYFVPTAKLLDLVRRGDLIGTVYDADGAVATQHTAPVDGALTILRQQALVDAGDMLFEISDVRTV